MPYLTEAEVRTASQADRRQRFAKDAASVLNEELASAERDALFDVFLCHSIKDAEIVQGTKSILQKQGLTVYVDWIVDPQMSRAAVDAATAAILRRRMNNSSSLFYLYSNNSSRSKWMPWEIGYFDGRNGSVAILPVVPATGSIDFEHEEYLGLYPKIEIQKGGVFVNRTKNEPVNGEDTQNWDPFETWINSKNKLRPR